MELFNIDNDDYKISRRLFKFIVFILFVKLAVHITSCFGPFVHPHIHRQSDTIGVSFRYFLRWFVEPNSHHLLLPAVLQSGPGEAIMSMEFPLMNLLGAPWFGLGYEAGFSAARVFWILSFWGLWAINVIVWGKQKSPIGKKMSAVWFIIPLIGLTSKYMGRYMPDYLAFSLVSLACALSFDRPRYILSFILMSLGLLVKPPVIVAAGVLLLRPWGKLKKDIFWLGGAFLVCILYYTLGSQYLLSLADRGSLFKTKFRSPPKALMQFFSRPDKIFEMFNERLLVPYISIIFALVSVFLIKFKKISVPWAMIGILGLQIIAVASLDGNHTFIHDYYLIGCMGIVGLLFVEFFSVMSSKLKWFFVITIFIYQAEWGFYETRKVFKKTMKDDCLILKKNNDIPWDKGQVFRTNYEKFPQLGLCFGERVNGTTSKYGFYQNEIPNDCHVIDQSGTVKLVECEIANLSL